VASWQRSQETIIKPGPADAPAWSALHVTQVCDPQSERGGSTPPTTTSRTGAPRPPPTRPLSSSASPARPPPARRFPVARPHVGQRRPWRLQERRQETISKPGPADAPAWSALHGTQVCDPRSKAAPRPPPQQVGLGLC